MQTKRDIMEIKPITDRYVHIHDASNYAREVLSAHGRMVSTLLGSAALAIIVRRKASLDGFSIEVPLHHPEQMRVTGGNDVWVNPDDLLDAVAKLDGALPC
jgi:hypothetical protein